MMQHSFSRPASNPCVRACVCLCVHQSLNGNAAEFERETKVKDKPKVIQFLYESGEWREQCTVRVTIAVTFFISSATANSAPAK